MFVYWLIIMHIWDITCCHLPVCKSYNYTKIIFETTEPDHWSHDFKMAAFSCLQIFLMIGMLITGSINTLSKKAQNDSVYVINDAMLYDQECRHIYDIYQFTCSLCDHNLDSPQTQLYLFALWS